MGRHLPTRPRGAYGLARRAGTPEHRPSARPAAHCSTGRRPPAPPWRRSGPWPAPHHRKEHVMLVHATVEKMITMHLTAMAEAFQRQLAAPQFAELSFEDRVGMLIDHEWTAREQRK